jgi:S-adenosylmethionine hydrolase
MIVLFTDFGADDIYVAQIKARLLEVTPPSTMVVDLLHSVPDFDPQAGAHLLAALQSQFPPRTVFLTVIDPGVGSTRGAAVMKADDRWFVGPDNGLLSVVWSRASQRRTWRITWVPERLSASFHGRDIFAPIAACIARGDLPADRTANSDGLEVSFGAEDLSEIIYIDHYGNALSGVRANGIPTTTHLRVGGRRIPWARVFSDVPTGSACWYENSIGLVEIAINGGRAADQLALKIGDRIEFNTAEARLDAWH